jgi:hypothetical protein
MGCAIMDVVDVRSVLRTIGSPSRVCAEMPKIQYLWDCGCLVDVDSDAITRLWTRCHAHERSLPVVVSRTP